MIKDSIHIYIYTVLILGKQLTLNVLALYARYTYFYYNQSNETKKCKFVYERNTTNCQLNMVKNAENNLYTIENKLYIFVSFFFFF